MAIRCKNLCKGSQRPAESLMAQVLLLTILAVLFAGCIPAVHELKEPVAAPSQFSEPGSSPLPDKWWLSFEDTVLNSLIEQALSNNFSLKAAWDRLSQAEATARKAGAGLYPTLDAEAGVSQTHNHADGQTTQSDTYTLGLAASYELDLWGRIRSSRDAATFDMQASAEDLQTAALTLSAQVAGTWYQLVEQYGQLEVLNAQISTNEKALELVTLQFRTGKVGIADVLQQRQLIEATRGEKTQVEADVKVLEHQLSILLGYPPQQTAAPRVSTLLDLAPMPQTGLPAELIQQRPDIRAAYFRVQAADSDLAAAVANRFPRLSITASAETTVGNTEDLFNNWLTTLAANLVAPVIDGGQRKAEVDRTRAAASEALNTYGQTILVALGEVEDALAKEQRQREFIDSLEKQLTLAGQVVERVHERYLQGTLDYQRALDALLSQQVLQRSLLTAKRNLVQDRIDLCRALGTGWDLERPGQDPSDTSPTTDNTILSWHELARVRGRG